MAYGNVQQNSRGRKRKNPYLWMIQGQADQRQGHQSVVAKMNKEQDLRDRAQDTSRWNRNFNLQTQQAATAADSARFAAGSQMTGMGLNVVDKFGGAGGKWGLDSFGGRGGLGAIGGGAAMGYGLASMFGSGSKKNQKYGALAGGALGWLLG